MVNFIMVSNHDNPVKIEPGDRRYCIVRTADKKNR